MSALAMNNWIDIAALNDIPIRGPIRGARVTKTVHGYTAIFRGAENKAFAIDDAVVKDGRIMLEASRLLSKSVA